jgi:hypothetical protein
MGATFLGVYIVYKAVNIFVVAVIVLYGNLNMVKGLFCADRMDWFLEKCVSSRTQPYLNQRNIVMKSLPIE